jgi:WD40 repeat protein
MNTMPVRSSARRHLWSVYILGSVIGRRVLSGSGGDDTLKLWDAATGAFVRTFEGHSHAVRSVAFSPDGRRVLSGSEDNTMKLWDVATGALVRTFEGHSGRVHSVAFSPDGRRIISGSGDTTIRIWDAATGTQLAALAAEMANGWR